MKRYKINSIGISILGVPQGTVIEVKDNSVPNMKYWNLID
jgi:hypothetical protein